MVAVNQIADRQIADRQIAERPTGVIARERTALGSLVSGEPQSGSSEADNPDRPLTTLRGASVAVDPRRAAQFTVAICWVTLAVLVVVFYVIGIHKNDQITSLKQHGVTVEDTVSGCLGELGGSGSNAAGYRCWGTYTIDGRRYSKDIPGNVLRAEGSEVPAVADPSDPGLITTVTALHDEQASASVFILPSVLLAALVLLTAALAFRIRSARAAQPALFARTAPFEEGGV
jgi:hypothetical protein